MKERIWPTEVAGLTPEISSRSPAPRNGYTERSSTTFPSASRRSITRSASAASEDGSRTPTPATCPLDSRPFGLC